MLTRLADGSFAPETELHVLRHTLYCIDYLLLNASAVGLLRSGLAGLSDNDLKTLVATAASNRSVATAIYQWPERLSAFLRKQILSLTPEMLASAYAMHDDLGCSISPEVERLTSLSSDEIVAARAWLAVHRQVPSLGKRIKVDASQTRRFFEASLYAGTLHGKNMRFLWPRNCAWAVMSSRRIEYPRARVRGVLDERSNVSTGTAASLRPLADCACFERRDFRHRR
jgi:hypothetical protein